MVALSGLPDQTAAGTPGEKSGLSLMLNDFHADLAVEGRG
jgi:hypothetical protein